MALYDQPDWRESMRVRFDFNNAMVDAIGPDHGVAPDAVNGLADRVSQSHSALKERRAQGDVAWMNLPTTSADIVRDILEYAESVSGKFENLVVLGIGGSSLGITAIASALTHPFHNLLQANQRQDRPRLFVLDNVDPDQFRGFLDVVAPERTLFNVITKSGSTSETMSQFLIVRKALVDAIGDHYVDHIVCTTDPANGELRKLVERDGYRSFDIPPGVGGRFSVLTPVGLLAGALIGIDIAGLLAGAAYAETICSEPDVWRNPAYMNAVIHFLGYGQGRPLSVMMPYSQALRDVADWYRQIWAESLGKRHGLDGKEVHVGPTPIKSLGVTDQHSQVQLYVEGRNDKIINFISVARFKHIVEIPSGYPESTGVNFLGGHSLNELMQVEKEGTEVALTAANRPNVTFTLPEINAFTVGQILYMLEIQTAMCGELFRIDTYDQPGVEAGKVAAFALMGRPGFETQRADIQSARRFSPTFVI